MLAARLEIDVINKRIEGLKDEEEGLEAAAKLYRDIQAELRDRQEDESNLRRNIRDLKKDPVVDAAVKLRATARNRATSIPVKSANVSSLATIEVAHSNSKTVERVPIFDPNMGDDSDEDESSEDGMSNRELDEDETPSHKRSGQEDEKNSEEESKKEAEDKEPEDHGSSPNGNESD
jgi:hypothetical protein